MVRVAADDPHRAADVAEVGMRDLGRVDADEANAAAVTQLERVAVDDPVERGASLDRRGSPPTPRLTGATAAARTIEVTNGPRRWPRPGRSVGSGACHERRTMNEDGTPKRHRRRRIIVLGVIAGLVVLVVGGAATILLTREEARPVSRAEASRRFERAHPAVSADGSGLLAPAEGVYDYRGHGSDSLSVLPFKQSHGPTMPGTIVHGKRCWTFRIDYSTHHWQNWTYCPRPDHGLNEKAGRTFQRWDIGVTSIDNHSIFRCTSPILVPGMQPDDRFPQVCKGTSDQIPGDTTSAGGTRYLGIVPVRVGGAKVPAYHLVQHRKVTGSQRGTERSEFWLAPNGLPLHEKHSITVKSGSPLGDVTYHEVTDFRLQALQPRS
jgi:hypothetical protein